MTDTSPREEIAKTIGQAPRIFYFESWKLSDERNNYIEADSVIRWLWERADDPAVIESVAKAIQKEVDGYYSGLQYDDVTEKEARAAIHANLTALIGPRPGSEDER